MCWCRVWPTLPASQGASWQGTLEVVLSRHILDELTRVLPRLNHRLKWRPVDFADLADILAIEIDLVEPQPLSGDTVRDATDIPVLGTLLAAKADYLITGDHDLLALAERHPIISPPPSSGSDMVGDGGTE